MIEREAAVQTETIQKMFEPLIDADEAALLLHVHVKTLQRWARGGMVPGRQIGRCWYFRQSELDAWWTGVQSPCHPSRVQ